jgi:hypothetical protein
MGQAQLTRWLEDTFVALLGPAGDQGYSSR